MQAYRPKYASWLLKRVRNQRVTPEFVGAKAPSIALWLPLAGWISFLREWRLWSDFFDDGLWQIAEVGLSEGNDRNRCVAEIRLVPEQSFDLINVQMEVE